MTARLLTVAAAALVLAASVQAAGAQTSICKVTDPTGTPLNVRAAPGGAVVGTIGNGRDVEILDNRDDARGRAWSLIRQPGAPAAIGWVFREFISCYR